MGYHPNIKTVRLDIGDRFNFFGKDTSLSVVTRPDLGGPQRVTHTGSRTVLVDGSPIRAEPVSTVDAPTPAGGVWVDETGGVVDAWSYTVTVTATAPGRAPVVWLGSIDVPQATGVVHLDPSTTGELVASGVARSGATVNPLTGGVESVGAGDPATLEPLASALDTRDPRPLVVAQASDSTGDSSAEWFEISFRELLAEKWPERPARVNRWDKATDAYAATETWQAVTTPGVQEAVTLARDTFSVDKPALHGTTDETGNTWSVTGGTLAVSGGYLTQPAAALSQAAVPLGTHDGVDGTSTMTFNIASTGSLQRARLVHSSNSNTGGNRLQLEIGGTGGGAPALLSIVDGVTTTLATWPTVYWSSSPLTLAVTVTGTSVSATVNGEARAATINPAVIGKTHTYVELFNAQGIQVNSFERTGTATVDTPSPLDYLTAYNAGYAGGRAEHQLARLDTMFPERPDVLFINHGHNYAGAGSTPEAFESALMTFVDAFHAKYPGVPVVALSQNPEIVGGAITQARVDAHHARQRHLREMCKRRGWGYIPGLEAFMALADMGASRINADGIHPLTGDGSGTGARLQADVAKAWIGSQSLRP